MEQSRFDATLLKSKWISVAFLMLGTISSILYSPKWHNPIFAWLGPFCLLFFFRLGNLKGKYLWFGISAMLIYLFSAYDVAPLPFTFLAALAALSAIHTMIIFTLDRLLTKRTSYFVSTLFFPSACVLLEFLNLKIAGGSWWSIANTQYPFKWLIQFASVSGLWGISFLIYWFASVTVWAIKEQINHRSGKTGLTIYVGILILVLALGAFRYYSGVPDSRQWVKVAGISVPLLDFKQQLYEDYSGNDIRIDPKSSIISPAFQQVNNAWFNFVETGDTVKFKKGFKSLIKVNDSLFTLSQLAANMGANIICWSEGNSIAFNSDEPALVQRGEAFAAKNKICLLMAIESIEPGKITPGKKFIHNKTILIDTSGKVINIFYKNKPVPRIERTQPGDGKIPVIASQYGNISPSICYDADFPVEMRQLGKNKIDLLLLPAGDWYAISPYHTYMAAFRGIENGCSVFRQTSGGLSSATDYRGKSYGNLDYYKADTKLWIANLPIRHVVTLYTIIGDAFVNFCMAVVLITIIYLLIKFMRPLFHNNEMRADKS